MPELYFGLVTFVDFLLFFPLLALFVSVGKQDKQGKEAKPSPYLCCFAYHR